MIRFGFRFIESTDWQGGYNYLLNLCKSLIEYDSDSIQPVIFYPEAISKNDFEPYKDALGKHFICNDKMAKMAIRSRAIKTLVGGCDKVSRDILQSHQVDVMFENADFYGRSFPIPAVSWIPDFQHRHLQGTFTKRQYWQREIGFRALFAAKRPIMVSSHDAKKDCIDFYRLPDSQVHVVRFGVPYISEPEPAARSEVIRKYELPDDFYFLPNQFWKHKNHLRVVEALHLLKQQGRDVVIAVSGGATNSTCVASLNEVESRVKELGLESSFRLLGRIPYADLLCLLTGCKALLNPSRFEGWSTPIEEAKAFGVNMILSNLPVHNEQVGDAGLFFDPLDIDDMAEKLWQAKTKFDSKRPEESDLKQRSSERMREFSNQFTALAQRAFSGQ